MGYILAVTQFVMQLTHVFRNYKVLNKKIDKNKKKMLRENSFDNEVSEIHKKDLVLFLKVAKDYKRFYGF